MIYVHFRQGFKKLNVITLHFKHFIKNNCSFPGLTGVLGSFNLLYLL